MKKLLSLLFVFGLAIGLARADEFTGKIATMSRATELSTDTWYALYDNTAKAFLNDDGSGTLTTSTTPALNNASEYTGVFFKLEASGDDYYLVSARGNYVDAIGSSSVTVSSSASAAYTFTASGTSTTTFTLQNSGQYLAISSTAAAGTSTSTQWTVYAVTLCSQSELTASQNTSYINKQLARSEGTLIRLANKRNSTSYLTGGASANTGAKLKSSTDLSQIWYVVASGDGVIIRNADTGKYLSDDYSEPASTSTTLYYQVSPNNGTSESYYNISSDDEYSGSTCLNLGNDGSTLYEWSYSGDSGCDWSIEIVYETTIDEVKANILANSSYASTLEAGKYYRLKNLNYGTYAADAGTYVRCIDLDESLVNLVWTATPSGSGYQLKNVLTDNYIQHAPSSMSTSYPTAETAETMYVTRGGDEWDYQWYITDASGDASGMHCDASANVVRWWCSGNAASTWMFEETTLTQEQIDAAKAEQAEYDNIVASLDDIKATLANMFTDTNCTTLNSTYAAMSDTDLENDANYQALPSTLQQMVLKIKNNTWASYEKFYRINEAEPMSSPSYWANQLNTTSYSPMNNPTGVTANCNDVVYVWVDSIPSGITMTLITHTNYTSFYGTESQTLSEGLNVFTTLNNMSQIYIDYTVSGGKLLTDYDFVPYHIEGGTVNGFLDARKQTDADWLAMWNLGYFSDEILDVISEKTQWRVLASAVSDMKRPVEAIGSWDKALRIQHELMGITAAPEGVDDPDGVFKDLCGKYFNNRMAAICYNGGGNPYSTTYYVYMSSTGSSISDAAETDPDVWVIGHEVGHHNQGAFNMAGCTEVSNNVFSNAVAYNFNLAARTESMSTRQELAESGLEGLSWATSTVYETFHATDLYAKLYFYYHVLGHNPLFFPKMFESLRNSPLENVRSGYSTTTAENEYLKFALVACEAAGEDLTDFFDFWGFFYNYGTTTVSDYVSTTITVTDAQIRRVKNKMAKYPKGNTAMMFLDDFADYNAGLKGAVDAARASWKADYEYGDYHDFEDWSPTQPHNIYASYNSSTGVLNLPASATGLAGIKVYDADSTLIYFGNTHKFTIPATPRASAAFFTAALPDGTEMPIYLSDQVKAGEAHRITIYNPEHPDGQYRYTNGEDTAIMTDERDGVNAVGVVSTTQTQSSEGNLAVLLAQKNIVSKDGVAQNFVIDGDSAMVIPSDFTAESISFTKSGDGYQALSLPFAVSNASTVIDNVIQPAETVAAGSPVVKQGAVSLSLTNAAVSAGTYETAESGYILSADGTSIASATEVSPFTYLFDDEASLTFATGINSLQSDATQNGSIYDLQGRRVTSARKGLYIVDGKKVMIK